MVVRRQCRRVLFPVVAILLASTARTSAQTGVAPDEVGVIEIDVSVVDRGGRPVSGLARESFDVTLPGFQNGVYTLVVKVTDSLGNTGTARAELR